MWNCDVTSLLLVPVQRSITSQTSNTHFPIDVRRADPLFSRASGGMSTYQIVLNSVQQKPKMFRKTHSSTRREVVTLWVRPATLNLLPPRPSPILNQARTMKPFVSSFPLLVTLLSTYRLVEAKESNQLTEVSRFISREFSSPHSSNGPATDESGRRRSLQVLADFDDVCDEMRLIFHQQCSCADFQAETSDTVSCNGYNGIEATAHFSQVDFSLETITVCKEQACTTIHYQNTSGLSCQASFGGTDRQCSSCEVCLSSNNLMGLAVDCTNIDSTLSTSCTAVSELLDLSAGNLPSSFVSSVWVGAVLLVLGFAV